METVDVIIVGAGPIGLEVAIGLKRAGVSYLHFEAGQIGSTIQWWAPQTRFFSSPERIAIAGLPLATLSQDKATREEYLAYLRQVVQHFELPVRTFERVTSIQPRGEGKGFLVSTRRESGAAQGDSAAVAELAADPGPGEHIFGAARVVVAMGDMHRPRICDIPGEDLSHVSHYFGDPHWYFRRRVLIVGGRNSAVEAAIRCHRIGARVTVSHRRADFDPDRIKYWLLPEIKGLIRAGHITHYPLTIPRAITPRTVRLGPAGVAAGTVEPFEVEADAVLLLTGYEMDGSLLEGAGVELVSESRMPQHNPRTMETNVPGLFVAGTASAGTQHRFKVFIENSHIHAARIVAAITGAAVPDSAQEPPETSIMPES